MEIKVKAAEVFAAQIDKGLVPVSLFKDAEITMETTPKPETGEQMVHRLTHSFEATLQTSKINRYAFRRLFGMNTNNELRRHHEPMKRRRTRPGRWMRRHWLWPALKEQRHGRKARRVNK